MCLSLHLIKYLGEVWHHTHLVCSQSGIGSCHLVSFNYACSGQRTVEENVFPLQKNNNKKEKCMNAMTKYLQYFE